MGPKTRRQRGLTVAPSALRDLQQSFDYIADDSPDAAEQMVEQLWHGIHHLRSFPGSGHARRDLAGQRKLRFWPVGRFFIVYRTSPALVEIVAVLHGSRDIPLILRERDQESSSLQSSGVP